MRQLLLRDAEGPHDIDELVPQTPLESAAVAIPGFQTFMLPLLELLADGEEHTIADVRDRLAAAFQLTEADRSELVPLGRQTRRGPSRNDAVSRLICHDRIRGQSPYPRRRDTDERRCC